jgi:hypothetical protein
VGPTSGSFGLITISLKCFMRSAFLRISSCQRASISGDMVGITGVMVNSSSFIRDSHASRASWLSHLSGRE